LRIGLDRTYALKDIDSGQAAALENAIKVLESLGAQIVDVKMPNIAGLVDTGTRGHLPVSGE
jgi:Asp-tRNA(Asn)/Glu-tRNA(Gln) amidotransferase A subunit family amidase